MDNNQGIERFLEEAKRLGIAGYPPPEPKSEPLENLKALDEVYDLVHKLGNAVERCMNAGVFVTANISIKETPLSYALHVTPNQVETNVTQRWVGVRQSGNENQKK